MKIFFITFLLLITLTTECEAITAAKIIKVVDGDTIHILWDGKRHKIRLYGIDAPEIGQSYGSQAAYFLKQLALNKSAKLDKIAYDDHGRMLAIVYLDDKCLQDELLESGYAWVYDWFCRKDICSEWKQLQMQAKDARKGLWKKNKPIPPWQWRRR